MLSYNTWSILLQGILCLVLLIGCIILVKSESKHKWFIFILTISGLVLEGTDLCSRLLQWNISNHINYAISQLLFLSCLTGLYARQFIHMPAYVKYVIYGLASILFIISSGWLDVMQQYGFYPNVIISCIICGLTILYFGEVIKKGKVESKAFVFNIITFFFFAIETIISMTYNFLITNHLNWVAPIWLFRFILLIMFYISLIQVGWSMQKNNI